MPTDDRFKMREFDFNHYESNENILTIFDKDDNNLWIANFYDSDTCCGVREIGKFEERSWGDDDDNVSMTEKQIRRAARTLNYVLEEEILYLAYTNDSGDFSDTIAVLTEAGFTADRQFFNKNSGNIVTQWSKYIVSYEKYLESESDVANAEKQLADDELEEVEAVEPDPVFSDGTAGFEQNKELYFVKGAGEGFLKKGTLLSLGEKVAA